VRAAMAGVNAAVVGILAAALYDPVWITAVRDAADALIAGGALLLLMSAKAPPLLIVLLCAVCSVIRVLSA
jgi:chromate transporter